MSRKFLCFIVSVTAAGIRDVGLNVAEPDETGNNDVVATVAAVAAVVAISSVAIVCTVATVATVASVSIVSVVAVVAIVEMLSRLSFTCSDMLLFLWKIVAI